MVVRFLTAWSRRTQATYRKRLLLSVVVAQMITVSVPFNSISLAVPFTSDLTATQDLLSGPQASRLHQSPTNVSVHTNLNVAKIDHARVLKAANQYLKETPITITASSSPRSAGGAHD